MAIYLKFRNTKGIDPHESHANQMAGVMILMSSFPGEAIHGADRDPCGDALEMLQRGLEMQWEFAVGDGDRRAGKENVTSRDTKPAESGDALFVANLRCPAVGQENRENFRAAPHLKGNARRRRNLVVLMGEDEHRGAGFAHRAHR